MNTYQMTKLQNGQSALYVLLILFAAAFAPKISNASEIPRFVSFASDKVFLRVGPGQEYPVKWEYRIRNYPVEIVREFDHWRKIKDVEGYEGWVHKSLLSTQRTAIAVPDQDSAPIYLKRDSEADAQNIAEVEAGAVLALRECSPAWCSIRAQGITGYIERKFLFGIYEDEIIE